MAATRRDALRTIAGIGALGLAGCGDGGYRAAALTQGGTEPATLMDFDRPFPLDPLPAGWRHRTFWTRSPMTFGFAEKDGVRALRCATDASASMLFRAVDFDIGVRPVLAWRWYIEQGIASAADERTHDGDDHPARLFLAFRTGAGEERRMEIVWGNRIDAPGTIYRIKKFPHFVADGGEAHVHQWRNETVDLATACRRIWPGDAVTRLTDIAVFCDSDETGGRTVAYFASIRLRRAT